MKKIIFLICIGVVFISSGIKAQQSYSISGTVSDEKGQPVPGATVFLTDSKKAIASDGSGKFALKDLQPGNYELVVNMLGFITARQSIKLQDRSIDIPVKLQGNNILLSAVTIKGGPQKLNKRDLKIFTENFIGTSANASKCKILNPDVLSFQQRKGQWELEASATDFLIIENTALGYRIKYLLKKFIYYYKYGACYYDGNPYFEELEGTAQQKKRWAVNRRLAYLGSYRHFFKAAMNSTSRAEGFYVWRQDASPALKIGESPKVTAVNIDSTLITVNKNFKALVLKPLIPVKDDTVYTQLTVSYLGKVRDRITWIKQMVDTILIDKNGGTNPGMGFSISGDWAKQRVADLTPLDYFVDPLENSEQRKITINDGPLKNKIAVIDSFYERQPTEKLYLQTDKPYYAIGDTMRFKAYLLDESLSASLKSGIMYVELINDSSRVCKRQTIMVSKGSAWGDIVIKKTWYPGNYTLRAYTNWMRNFGEVYFFTKQISIMPSGNGQWLVNERLSIDKGKNINVSLHFNDFERRSIGFRGLQLSILYGTSVLLKNKTKTDANGNADISFGITEKLAGKQLTLLAEDISKEDNGRKTIIPIQFSRPENIDLQFMPEGGNLIAAIKTRVGFKAIGEDGKGRYISGKVYDSKQQEVAAFKSTHLGMGSFELTPIAGESYTAKLDWPDGTTKGYALPIVNPSGVALRIDQAGNDSLKIIISNATISNNYYLIGQSRDKVCYAAKITFKDKEVHKEIAKDVFPTGIVKWVVLDAESQPVSQRMVFIDHNDRLSIRISGNKENYLQRDSVGLQLTVTDKDGDPVQGDFSLAVTDDNQVKAPGNDEDNIVSYMLLNPDLKGYIEDADYYFNKEHANRETALDNLLLTQGWTGYDWKPVFETPLKPEYDAETQITVKGRASNFFNKSIAKTDVYLLSKKPNLLFKAKTGTDGRFVFDNFPKLDTINFRIQTKRTANIGIKVDEFVPPEYVPSKIPVSPWYVNSDSTLVNYANKKQEEEEEAFNAGKSKLLKEVDIHSNRIEPPPPPLLHLEEEEIRNARTGKKPMTLQQLLDRNGDLSQMNKTLIIDGDVLTQGGRFDPPATNAQIMAWLEEFTTEDIKAITARKVYADVKYKRGDQVYGGVSLVINITTNVHMHSGSPPTGAYQYRPMPISWPHKFYSPKYAVKDTVAVKDRRSTIFWAPDIVTDINGKAEVSFYSADAPGTYTLRLEGGDMDGNVGYYRQKIKIGSTTLSAK